MRNQESSAIDSTMNALEEAIENKKAQMEHAKAQSSAPVASHLFSEILNTAGGSSGYISTALEHGGEFVQGFMKKAQQHVQENPWEALRKVAVYSFGIGMFLSMRHKRPPTGEKE